MGLEAGLNDLRRFAEILGFSLGNNRLFLPDVQIYQLGHYGVVEIKTNFD